MDVVKTCCRNFSEALQLATDQRYAHEYGDTAAAEKLQTGGESEPGPHVHEKPSDHQEAPEDSKEERRRQGPLAGTHCGDASYSAKKRRSYSFALSRAPVIDYEDLQR